MPREFTTAGPLRSAGIPPPPLSAEASAQTDRYHEPVLLPLAFGHFPASGYTAYPFPSISTRGKEGFSSCSMCPCPHAVASTPPECSSALAIWPLFHVAFIPRRGIRPLGLLFSGPPMPSLSLRPDDSLTIPKMALWMGFRQSVSLLPAILANGFWLLPMQVYLLLNTPAFPGRAVVDNYRPVSMEPTL